MGVSEDFRRRARATWASGDWDTCARLIEPVGAVVLDRIDLRPVSTCSTSGRAREATSRSRLRRAARTWPEFVQWFADIVRRLNLATDGTARLQAAYLLITFDR